MEIVMSVIAVGAACSCLFFLIKSDASDFSEQRKPAEQKMARQQHSPMERD